MKKEDRQRFTLRITQANSTELVVILYEMLLCYLEDAENALREEASGGNSVKKEASADKGALPDSFREAVRKARGCLNELIESLNLKYEPAAELLQLYMFCIRRLALGEARRDAELLGEIKRVIKPLHEAYRKIASQNTSGPVMRNSQTVYAGLTYGRKTLTENMADQGANRGMLV